MIRRPTLFTCHHRRHQDAAGAATCTSSTIKPAESVVRALRIEIPGIIEKFIPIVPSGTNAHRRFILQKH